MKYLLPFAALTILTGCNSSNSSPETPLPQTPPPAHLPGDLIPDRPHPDAGEPGHLPGDLIPDRLPITWYQEVANRFGMTTEALDHVCRYQGTHPQMDIHVSCNWQNEELTIVYFVSRSLSEPEYFYDHAFTWVVSDEHIANGKLWPGINHKAVGLDSEKVSIAPDGVMYSVGYDCIENNCTNIQHTLNIQSNGNHVTSDGTPYYGISDFNIDTYRKSERFYVHLDFDIEGEDSHRNTLHLLDDFPGLVYKVLAPAFGY
ncbi:hypothetical protein ACNUDM_04690 [Vibrio chaetopteri]|jgi:hypothetical protein|uniref:hypothetical protein n=1 Tax=Vibrio chaetopteri TaxID=3016528 RepID=UPI003AB69296